LSNISGTDPASMWTTVSVMTKPAQLTQLARTFARLALDLPGVDPKRPFEVSVEARRPAGMIGVEPKPVRFSRLANGVCRIAPGVVVAMLAVRGAPMMLRGMLALMTGLVAGQEFGTGRPGLCLQTAKHQCGSGGDQDLFHDGVP